MILDNNLTVPAEIEHTVTGVAKCHIGDAPFTFAAAITYVPKAWLLELIEYDAAVRELANRSPTTIEELCMAIFDETWSAVQPQRLVVKMAALTSMHGDTIVKLEKEREV